MTGEYFTVTGGAASMIAWTEDLDRAVRALHDAAALMDTVTGQAARAQAASSGSWGDAVVMDRLDEVMYGPSGSRRAADLMTDMAHRLAATVRAMEEAELASQHSLGLLAGAWERQTSLLGTLWAVSAKAYRAAESRVPWPHLSLPIPDPGPVSTTGWLNRTTVDVAVGAMEGWGRDALVAASKAALELGEFLAGERAWAGVIAAPGGEAMVAPRSLADLVYNDWAMESRGDGAVGIQKVTGPDGETRFIVSVPGTQDWGFADNIFDGTSNLQMMQGPLSSRVSIAGRDHGAVGEADPLRHVAAVIAAAGVPEGAELMLVGHSQGGIVASTLAASAAFTQKYSVTHVVTTGSPTGAFHLQRGVKALHVEHQEDLVPGTDGIAVTPTADRTTFVRDLSQSPDPHMVDLSATISGAHSYVAYQNTAALAESGVSSSVTAFMASADNYLSPEATVTSEVYIPVVKNQD